MNPIEEILARAMKSASDTARSDENSKDVKENIVASVDETNSSDAFGTVDKENTVILTGQEATTDEKEDGLPKITNDGDAFKEASAGDLASVASDILASITKAAADALDVEAAENGGKVEDSEDATGTEEDVSDNGTEAVSGSKEAGLPDAMEGDNDTSSDPKPEGDTVATDAAGEEEKKAAELESELETFFELREKFAALDEMLGGVDDQASQDAGNVAEFLQAFQQAPAVDEMGGEGEAGAPLGEELPPEGAEGELPPEAMGLPEEGGMEGGEEAGAVEELIQVLAEAGINPEELLGQLGAGEEVPPEAAPAPEGLPPEAAPVEEKLAGTGWDKLSKEARRSLVEDALRKNLSKGDK